MKQQHKKKRTFTPVVGLHTGREGGKERQAYWEEEAGEAGEPAEGAGDSGAGESGEAAEVEGIGSVAGLSTFLKKCSRLVWKDVLFFSSQISL